MREAVKHSIHSDWVPSAGSSSSSSITLLKRLLKEDHGIRGSTWFARRSQDNLHVFANIIRLFWAVVFAPVVAVLPFIPVITPFVDPFIPFDLTALTPKTAPEIHYNYDLESDDDSDEEIDTDFQKAILHDPPKSSTTVGHTQDSEVYATTGFDPRWMLKVTVRNGQYWSHEQVKFDAENFTRRHGGYTALSYDMSAAVELFIEAGDQRMDPKPKGADWSWRDRQRISKRLLLEYCSAIGDADQNPNREEFIWLDEFCISDGNRGPIEDFQDNPIWRSVIKEERNAELGRLVDIFRGAQTVVVFCHEEGCDHTSTTCSWGQRLFTLSEILHAEKVKTMTRRKDTRGSRLNCSESGRSFRERMMHHAERAKMWHLHSVMRQSNNSGSDTWQMAIHALVVEAIRRDKESKYFYHEYIGKALNGLLPRKAHLHHLTGEDGWRDLAWLLELNQGFYNTAALAAVCCLPDLTIQEEKMEEKKKMERKGYIKRRAGDWLGPPIEPKAGSERLEPLVHAFPVLVPCKEGKKEEKANDSKRKPLVHASPVLVPCKEGEKEEKANNSKREFMSVLNVVGAETIGLHPYLRRDSNALFTNKDAKKAKIISMVLLAVFYLTGAAFIVAAVVTGLPSQTTLLIIGIIIVYLSSLAFSLFRLIKSTLYLERSGWVFLREEKWPDDRSKGNAPWTNDPEVKFRTLDPTLHFTRWDEDQMVPKWEETANGYKRGWLADLRTGTLVKTVVSEEPDTMMVLGIHGSGVTYMLLKRSEESNGIARRVGMASLPPFTLAFTKKVGSMRIRAYEDDEPEKESPWKRFKHFLYKQGFPYSILDDDSNKG
ncbi:hypothetical protein K435DRAFT_839793 [Dendrothele bispora CBS 962.96]|uniref:Heterokaryon incompatibility domain-containing protein n=1 Tax=Dendrothele bispora (strain CBS 962.96) TaxID=1314807 RepID=A0A4S8LYB5_DENBC|nr:hypothetical protein K435DRAFT_839793 [Dendrothele bispora CBS 962.96]